MLHNCSSSTLCLVLAGQQVTCVHTAGWSYWQGPLLYTHCRWWYVTGWYLLIAECGAAWGLAPGDTGQCWEQCLVSVRTLPPPPPPPGVMMSASAVMGDNFILSGRGDDKLIQVSHFPTNFASRSNLTTPFSKITSLTLWYYKWEPSITILLYLFMVYDIIVTSYFYIFIYNITVSDKLLYLFIYISVVVQWKVT